MSWSSPNSGRAGTITSEFLALGQDLVANLPIPVEVQGIHDLFESLPVPAGVRKRLGAHAHQLVPGPDWIHLDPPKIRTLEVGTVQAGTTGVSVAQNGSFEVSSAQTSISQVRACP